MAKRIRALDTKLNIARRATWASYFLLILSLLASGHLSGLLALVALATLPLLLLLPGMMRERYKTLAMLSFASLMYFIPLVVNAMKPGADFFSMLSLGLVCILFTASMFFSRWKQYDLAGLGDPPAEPSQSQQ